MKYSPKTNNISALMLSIFLTVISVFSLYAGSIFLEIKWLFQLLFLCFATAAIQFLLKYVLTTYEYECKDGNLLIYKSVGKKNALIESIPLVYSESYFIKNSDFYQEEQLSNISAKYVYTRNLGTKDIFCYLTGLGGKKSLLLIECNNEFADFLNSAIDKAMKGNTDDEI